MKTVVIESPFAGDWEKNLRYLRACMRDCLLRDEAPYASHGLYTQEGVLNDDIPEERRLGMEAGFMIGKYMERVIVYTDLGISDGMQQGISRASNFGKIIEFRSIPRWDKQEK